MKRMKDDKKRYWGHLPTSVNYQITPIDKKSTQIIPSVNYQITSSLLTGRYYGLGDLIDRYIKGCAQGLQVANRVCLIDPTKIRSLRNQMTLKIQQLGESQTSLTPVQKQTFQVNLTRLSESLIAAVIKCSNQASVNLIEQCIDLDPVVQSTLKTTQNYLQSVHSPLRNYGSTRLDVTTKEDSSTSSLIILLIIVIIVLFIIWIIVYWKKSEC